MTQFRSRLFFLLNCYRLFLYPFIHIYYFGDNAINRNFTEYEVIERIKEFSDKAWNFDLHFELEQEEDDE